MLVSGYKMNSYDATYYKALFNVIEQDNRVLEITETESGMSFVLDFEDVGEEVRKICAWRKQELSGKGKSIHFGRAGFFEQLKYYGQKKKDGL